MREDICSIPVSEMFEPKEGCPVCRMRDMLEDRMIEYITGAAMMEPDVRVETNRDGFCERHYMQMRARGSRLPLALLLETRLQYLEDAYFGGENGLAQAEKSAPSGLAALRAKKDDGGACTCFVCKSMEKNLASLIRNTVLLWQREPDFQKLYAEQEFLCLPHYRLLRAAADSLSKKERPAFLLETDRLAGERLLAIEKDVTHFCRMFDYRNQDGDWGNSRDSIERAVAFLTGSKPAGTEP